jgi:transposase
VGIGNIDGTSLSVEGKYIHSEEKQKENSVENEKEEDDEPIPIKINHGYSRAHRPDLQQIAIKRVCVQNTKTLPELDLVTHPCGRLDLKSL